MQYISLMPVLIAALLQFCLTAVGPPTKILTQIIELNWTFPGPMLQEIEFLKMEAQQILDSFSQRGTQPGEEGAPTQVSESKVQVVSVGGQYYNVEIQYKWASTSGISLPELLRLNYWTNESTLALGLSKPSIKFIFSVMSCYPQTESFTLAIYRFDKLLHSENHHLNFRCSCLYLDSNDLKGVYTFVAFFNRPVAVFPFSGYISLHDFRFSNVKQILLPCAPAEIKDFPHIWIVGHLTIDETYSIFGCKLVPAGTKIKSELQESSDTGVFEGDNPAAQQGATRATPVNPETFEQISQQNFQDPHNLKTEIPLQPEPVRETELKPEIVPAEQQQNPEAPVEEN